MPVNSKMDKEIIIDPHNRVLGTNKGTSYSYHKKWGWISQIIEQKKSDIKEYMLHESIYR